MFYFSTVIKWMVSYTAWRYGISYRQETVCEGFPIRLDSVVFLTDRKLISNSFLFGLTLWFSLPTGNCWRKVSYSAWRCGGSYRQETIHEGFLSRLDSVVFLTDRKLFAKGFLFGLTLWWFSPLSFRAVVQVSISSMPHGAGETESRNLLLKGSPSSLTL